jgi:hypothetical protein
MTSRAVVGAVLVSALTGWCGSAAADPLDNVSGTEGWERVVGVDYEAEWRHWRAARRQWREARRELRLQRLRNRRLARVLRRARILQRGSGKETERARKREHRR